MGCQEGLFYVFFNNTTSTCIIVGSFLGVCRNEMFSEQRDVR